MLLKGHTTTLDRKDLVGLQAEYKEISSDGSEPIHDNAAGSSPALRDGF